MNVIIYKAIAQIREENSPVCTCHHKFPFVMKYVFSLDSLFPKVSSIGKRTVFSITNENVNLWRVYYNMYQKKY